jgi:hypothetical protein
MMLQRLVVVMVMEQLMVLMVVQRDVRRVPTRGHRATLHLLLLLMALVLLRVLRHVASPHRNRRSVGCHIGP